MNSEACKNCRFFNEWDIGDMGECHRYPPKLIHASRRTVYALEATTFAFPTVQGSDYCGEYRYVEKYENEI